MQRYLTAAAAAVSTIALMSGVALAQSSSSPSAMPTSPSATAPSSMTPSSSMTNPSTSGATSSSSMGGQAQNGAMDSQPEQIRQAQKQLKSQGLYNGTVDGKMGPETAQAISKFQQQNGLPQNSQLDQQTMAKLGGNGTAAGSGSSTPPATMNPSSPSSTSNPGAGGSMGSGGASTPSTSGSTSR